MSTEEKNRFDALATLWKGAWEQFNERRRYEFQISLAVWTAFASFIALTLTSKFKECNPSMPQENNSLFFFGVLVIVGLINLLYYMWISGIQKANMKDKAVAFHYEKLMQNLSNSPFDELLISQLKERSQNRGILMQWSHGSQFLITITLSIATIFVLILKY